MIYDRDNPAKYRMLRCCGRELRALTLVLLAFVLVFPASSELLAALRGGTGCTTSCCKAGRCRCHRPEHADQQSGRGWTAAPSCPSTCGQFLGRSGPMSWRLAGQPYFVKPGLPALSLPVGSRPARAQIAAGVTLFERPPPSLA